jgi:hypothetical protein
LEKKLFSVDIDNINSMRCIFPATRELKIEVENDVEVSLALRQYSKAAEVSLDGVNIQAVQPCNKLPNGLRQLYIESDVFPLRRGSHSLRLTCDAVDIPYIPLVFILGRFSLGKERIIRRFSATKTSVEECFLNSLQEYAGSVIFHLPNMDLKNYDGISFDYKGLAVELFIDEQSLGCRLWAPFEWKLPERFCKSGVNIKLLITTSIGPLFGNYPESQTTEMKALLNDWWPGYKER